MKYLIIPFLFAINSCFSQSYKTVEFDEVKKILNSKSETLYVFNFWANWSKDCEKELPILDKLEETYKDENIKVILICIDEAQDLEKWVEPFLKKMKFKSEVWWLSMKDVNAIKSSVDDNWKSEVPFTLFFRGSTMQKSWKDGGRWSEKGLNKVILDLL